jgi:hypothetical protein
MHPTHNDMPEDHQPYRDPLQAPEGYFAEFNGRLAERLPVQKSRSRIWAITAAAAMVAVPAVYWGLRTPQQPVQPLATVGDSMMALPSDIRLDDETLAAYIEQGEGTVVAPAAVTQSQPAAIPVSNASILSEEDLLRAGLLRAEEFETFDPML